MGTRKTVEHLNFNDSLFTNLQLKLKILEKFCQLKLSYFEVKFLVKLTTPYCPVTIFNSHMDKILRTAIFNLNKLNIMVRF